MTPTTLGRWARIDDAVRVTLEAATEPVSQERLALAVRVLAEYGGTEETCRRRVKESVSRLCASGLPVVSTSYGDGAGYRIARTPEDRAEGRRYLVKQLAGIARRLRSFDAAGSDAVRQLALALEAEAQP